MITRLHMLYLFYVYGCRSKIMRKSCFLLLLIADKILRKFLIKFLAFFKISYTANSDEMNVKKAENNNLKNYIPQI